jgi:hypothetical protein
MQANAPCARAGVSLNPKLRNRINAPTLVGNGLLLFWKRRGLVGRPAQSPLILAAPGVSVRNLPALAVGANAA